MKEKPSSSVKSKIDKPVKNQLDDLPKQFKEVDKLLFTSIQKSSKEVESLRTIKDMVSEDVDTFTDTFVDFLFKQGALTAIVKAKIGDENGKINSTVRSKLLGIKSQVELGVEHDVSPLDGQSLNSGNKTIDYKSFSSGLRLKEDSDFFKNFHAVLICTV